MIKQIGTKIYYCNLTGDIIKVIGDMQGYVSETTFNEDYNVYSELKERDKSTIGMIQFDYGVYFELSKNSTGVSIDLETLKPIFTYEDVPIQSQDDKFDYTMENEIISLYNQVEDKEKTIASLTYELMMLQEPIATMFIDGVSEKFNSIKTWYERRYWNDEMVLNAVIKGYISEDESKEILSE